jgi:hypothetical protein
MGLRWTRECWPGVGLDAIFAAPKAMPKAFSRLGWRCSGAQMSLAG